MTTQQIETTTSSPDIASLLASLPKQGFEVVTPAMAREWLKLNTSNRPLRKAHVAALKRMFERGEYKVTHQGVGFGADGKMQDGQHRLTALSMMPDDFAVVMSVTRGMSEDAYDAHDLGAKRSQADALRISKNLGEVSRFLAAIIHGTGYISPQYLRPWAAFAQPHYNALLKDLNANRRTWSTATVRAAAIISMARGVPVEYVREVYRTLLTADFNAMQPVVQAVFRAEANGRVASTDKTDLFVRCLKIFNPACAHLTKVQVKEANSDMADVREFLATTIPSSPQGSLAL